jgi:hypothetical protein
MDGWTGPSARGSIVSSGTMEKIGHGVETGRLPSDEAGGP